MPGRSAPPPTTTWPRASPSSSPWRCPAAPGTSSRPWRASRIWPSLQPRVVEAGACQEVVLTGDQVDLEALPVLQCWPLDAGRFITLPLVFTRHPRTGKRNVGMYRLQVFDKRTTGMHWHLHKDAAEHYRARRAGGSGRMEVAVAIGTDPAVTYAATAPLPGAVRRDAASPASCAARRWTWCSAAPSICRCRPTPRSCWKATSIVERDPARRAVRRSHRLLLAGRPVPGVPRDRAHPPARSRSTPPPSSGSLPWRTPTSARPPSGSSCRCCG